MKIYTAGIAPSGGGKAEYYANAIKKHKPFILESFYYADETTEKLLPYFGDFLLDSGAFTFMSSSKTYVVWEDYIERYADFINRNKVEKFFENFKFSLDKFREVYYCISILIHKGGEAMGWVLNKNRPVCPQICELICVDIVNGVFGPDGRLPSVRDVAVMVGVNPNTIVRSYQLLESQEIIYNKRGLGYFVKDGAVARIKDNVKNEFIANELPQFKAKAAMLGITKEELVELL